MGMLGSLALKCNPKCFFFLLSSRVSFVLLDLLDRGLYSRCHSNELPVSVIALKKLEARVLISLDVSFVLLERNIYPSVSAVVSFKDPGCIVVYFGGFATPPFASKYL